MCIRDSEYDVPVAKANNNGYYDEMLDVMKGLMQALKMCIRDSRYRSRKPLIVTTNLTLTELKNPQNTAHARIYDRLLEMCIRDRFWPILE